MFPTRETLAMRMSPILAVSLLALPLGGCIGVTLPPAPLPDWAMNPQDQEQFQEPSAATPRKKPRVVRREAPRDLTALESALVTGGAGAQAAPRTPEAKPFAAGWDALEEERDESLRRTMKICRNC